MAKPFSRPSYALHGALLLGLILVLGLWFWPNFIGHGSSTSSPDLAKRADSLKQLDPVREAATAAANGDLRFVGTCGYACGAFGPAHDSIAASTERSALAPDSLRLIEGTSDAILNEDMARLNLAARTYAQRYNLAMLHQRLRDKHPDKPSNKR